MAIIVFRGVEVQVDPSEFCADFRKLFVDESFSRIDFTKPFVKVQYRARPKGTIADIVRTTFTEVGVTKKIKANGDSAIRAAFYGEGWTAKVISTNKAGTFNVIRKS